MSDDEMDKLTDGIAKIVVAVLAVATWLSTVGYSAWLEYHGQHERAVWWLLLVIAHSCCWLRCIAKSVEKQQA